MTPIDELLRETLTAAAETHTPSADLAARSLRAGRRARRLRTSGMVAVAAAGVAAIVGGSVAIGSHTAGHGHTSNVQPAGGGAPSPRTTVLTTQPDPRWRDWRLNRVFGAKPGAPFFAGAGAPLYASGTMADGTQFALYGGPSRGEPIDWHQGWNNTPDFGESPPSGSPLFRPDAPFFGMESATTATQTHPLRIHSQWLIVAARPGTTSAEYSADGTSWQPMSVQEGIAVLRLAKAFPVGAQVRLANRDGVYYAGRLWIL